MEPGGCEELEVPVLLEYDLKVIKGKKMNVVKKYLH